jgi:hypothetical protein
MEPLVFIVGCARSGTTLLQRMVNAHPQIAISPETHWLTQYFPERKWHKKKACVTPEQITSIVQHERFYQLELSQEEFEGLLGADEAVRYGPFLERLFALYGRKKGKPLVGNKTPAYVQRIRKLHRVWPAARFLHLIRDGRDVCLSVLSWEYACRTAALYATWAEDPVSTTALWWARKVRLGREAGQALQPGLYHELRYEELIAQPAEECARLCDFLGVPYDEVMLRFHEGPPPPDQASHPWLPIKAGMRDWRAQLPAGDVERFEAAAGDLLDELGYPRAFPCPGPDRIKHAALLRELFAQDASLQKRVLPEGAGVSAR